MNIKPIMESVELLDIALTLTPEAEERKQLRIANDTLRAVLRKRGVFVGQLGKSQPEYCGYCGEPSHTKAGGSCPKYDREYNR